MRVWYICLLRMFVSPVVLAGFVYATGQGEREWKGVSVGFWSGSKRAKPNQHNNPHARLRWGTANERAKRPAGNTTKLHLNLYIQLRRHLPATVIESKKHVHNTHRIGNTHKNPTPPSALNTKHTQNPE